MVLQPTLYLALVGVCSLAAFVPQVAPAQNISIDGRFSSAQTLAGPNYAITADLGKQVGSNLFHSFGKFGLSTGDVATFSGPAIINNVIGRVTGGAQSTINGKIASTITGASLYLINPSGIVFGKNATVDVKGSFHASTADYLKMSDGAKFQATNPDGSTLSAAPPAAFGFLTARPAAITVNGSTLGPVPGTLGVVAGPVSITGGATLSAPAGTIHVTSVAGTGEVPVDPRNTPGLTVTNFGPVDIKGSSTLDVSDPQNLGSGGSVFIRAGALTIDASEINADNYGSGAGGMLSLRGDNQITLSNSAYAHAVAMGSGNGADVLLSTTSSGLVSVDAATVLTDSLGPGNGGALSLDAGRLTLSNGAGLISSTQGSGNGGPIKISANSVLLDGASQIGSTTTGAGLTGPSGNPIPGGAGGAISITAGSLTIQDGANIVTNSAGDGPGGAVALNIDGMLTVANLGSITSEADANGDGGPIKISANSVLVDGASIGSTTGLSGPSGNPIPAGAGGAISITAGSLTIQDGASIAAISAGDGHGGAVALNIDGMLTVVNLGLITSIAEANGDGGPIKISADAMLVDGSASQNLPTGIVSLAFGSGKAGDVAAASGTLSILTNGALGSVTSGAGDAGSVSVNVAGALTIDGKNANPDLFIATGISSLARGSKGNAGQIQVEASSLAITNGGVISASTFGLGNAGNVMVHAGTLSIASGGAISSDTSGSGNGGTILVGVDGELSVDGSNAAEFTGIRAQTTGTDEEQPKGSGVGGNISVNAGTLDIVNTGQISSSTFGSGSGGSVTVTATV